jgi:hypothetical protein
MKSLQCTLQAPCSMAHQDVLRPWRSAGVSGEPERATRRSMNPRSHGGGVLISVLQCSDAGFAGAEYLCKATGAATP